MGKIGTKSFSILDELGLDEKDVQQLEKGGKVSSSKAKEILMDGTAHGVKLSPKQKRYFGWIAGGRKANGGLIKLDDGGTALAALLKQQKDAQLANGISSGIGGAGSIANSAIDNLGGDAGNKAMAKDIFKDTTSFASSGAKLGSLLMPGAGTAIGAGIGGLLGLGLGAVEGSKAKNSINKKAKADEDAFGVQQREVNSQGYMADGGKVKGAGTGKSDSINAKLNPDDFVIPAENANHPITKSLMTALGLDKTAPLKKGGVPVKVSNGEVIIPQDKMQIADMMLKQSGIPQGINALAPNANKTDKLANGGMPNTSMNTEVGDNMPEFNKWKELVQNKYPNMRDKKENELMKIYKTYRGNGGMNMGGMTGYKKGGLIKLVDGGTPMDYDTWLKSVSGKTDITKWSEDKRRSAYDAYASAPAQQSAINENPFMQNTLTTNKGLGLGQSDDLSGINTGIDNMVAPLMPKDLAYKPDPTTGKTTPGGDGKFPIGTAAAIAQTGLGLANLIIPSKPGKINISPEVQKQYQDAMREAGYGFTPNEKRSLADSIELNRRAAMEAAIRFGGRSAGDAFNRSMAATFGADQATIKANVQDEKLRMSKQARVDSLALQIARERKQQEEVNRQNEIMKQKAAAGLSLAGINNLVQIERLRQYQKEPSMVSADPKYAAIMQMLMNK